MTIRSRLRGRSWLPVLAVVSTLMLGVPAAAGCGSNLPQPHCQKNATPRVSAGRVVTLYAVNYLYAGTISSNRASYISGFTAAMKDIYDEVNRIYAQNSMNLQIISMGSFDQNEPLANVYRITSEAQAAMVRVHESRPHLIGVHWPEWYSDEGNQSIYYVGVSPCPEPRCNLVVMAGILHRLLSHIDKIGQSLASAFGYYFNLTNSGLDTNLMHHIQAQAEPTGTELTIRQAGDVWEAINTGRPALLTMTCDKHLPVQPATYRPRLS